MVYYVSPNIPTDPDIKEIVPEPGANALQKELKAGITIPGNPIFMPTPNIEYPGVTYDPGWHQPQQLQHVERNWLGMPLQSPGVTYIPYSPEAQRAANPVATTSATGIRYALRAPGINEGL